MCCVLEFLVTVYMVPTLCGNPYVDAPASRNAEAFPNAFPREAWERESPVIGRSRAYKFIVLRGLK